MQTETFALADAFGGIGGLFAHSSSRSFVASRATETIAARDATHALLATLASERPASFVAHLARRLRARRRSRRRTWRRFRARLGGEGKAARARTRSRRHRRRRRHRVVGVDAGAAQGVPRRARALAADLAQHSAAPRTSAARRGTRSGWRLSRRKGTRERVVFFDPRLRLGGRREGEDAQGGGRRGRRRRRRERRRRGGGGVRHARRERALRRVLRVSPSGRSRVLRRRILRRPNSHGTVTKQSAAPWMSSPARTTPTGTSGTRRRRRRRRWRSPRTARAAPRRGRAGAHRARRRARRRASRCLRCLRPPRRPRGFSRFNSNADLRAGVRRRRRAPRRLPRREARIARSRLARLTDVSVLASDRVREPGIARGARPAPAAGAAGASGVGVSSAGFVAAVGCAESFLCGDTAEMAEMTFQDGGTDETQREEVRRSREGTAEPPRVTLEWRGGAAVVLRRGNVEDAFGVKA